MVSVYAVGMQPTFHPGFTRHTVTPNVCALCNGTQCATNDEDPGRRVMRFSVPQPEHGGWEVPPVEVGARCLRSKAAAAGGDQYGQATPLRQALQAAEDHITELTTALQAAEARAEQAEQANPLLEQVAADVRAVRDAATVAGVNTARKHLKATGAG